MNGDVAVLIFQVILVPCGITAQLDDRDKSCLLACCDDLISKLRDGGLRVRGDYRDHYSPGWKFNHWELKVSNYDPIMSWLLTELMSDFQHFIITSSSLLSFEGICVGWKCMLVFIER